MQSDGAWMTVMPLSRHAFRTGSAAFASSPHRFDAALHQWSSHMSQTITAVFAGSIATVMVAGMNRVAVTTFPPSALVSVTATRFWATTWNSPTGAAGLGKTTAANKNAAGRMRVIVLPSGVMRR